MDKKQPRPPDERRLLWKRVMGQSSSSRCVRTTGGVRPWCSTLKRSKCPMRVQRLQQELSSGSSYVLLDDEGQPIQVVSGFLSHLHARGLSPNTQAAYAYDLLHFLSFLKEQQLTYLEFTPTHALDLLAYLRAIPSRKQGNRL